LCHFDLLLYFYFFLLDVFFAGDFLDFETFFLDAADSFFALGLPAADLPFDFAPAFPASYFSRSDSRTHRAEAGMPSPIAMDFKFIAR
jgi:hypothetical protein